MRVSSVGARLHHLNAYVGCPYVQGISRVRSKLSRLSYVSTGPSLLPKIPKLQEVSNILRDMNQWALRLASAVSGVLGSRAVASRHRIDLDILATQISLIGSISVSRFTAIGWQ